MKYRQRINCVELTKLLEREIVDTLCFTYPLGHIYSSVFNPFLDNPGVYTNYGQELLPRHSINGNSRYKTRHEADSVLEIISLTIREVNPPPPVEYSTQVEIRINGELKYTRNCYYYDGDDGKQVPYNDGTIITTIPGSELQEGDSVQITYRHVNPNFPSQDMTATFEPIAIIANISNAPRKTVTEVINRVLDVGLGRKKNEPIKYKLDAVLAEEFSKIEAPEYMFTRNTLYEVLLQIGGTKEINAIPKLIWNEEDDEPNIITFTKLGSEDEYILPEGSSIIAYQDQTNPDEYCEELDSYVDNLVNSLDVNSGTITEPGPGNSNELFTKTLRSESGELAIYDNSVVITTEFPIYRVISLQQGYVNDNAPVGDITPYVFEQAEYDALTSYKGPYPKAKEYAVTYKQGDNKITGLSLKADTVTELGSSFTRFAAYNIAKAQGQDAGNLGLANYAYQITYIPIINTRLKQRRPNLNYGGGSLYYQQGANTVESSYYGDNMKYTLSKIGNRLELYTFRVFSLADLPKVGQVYDGKYICEVDLEENLTNYKVTIWCTPDYNRLSEYIGINSSKRFYEVSEKQSVDRIVNCSENIYIGDEQNGETSVTLDGISSVVGTFSNNKGSKRKVGCSIAQGRDRSEKTIATPTLHGVITSACGNSIAFHWKYADNYSAGNQAVAIEGADSKKMLRAVPYGDNYGQFYYLDMSLMERVPYNVKFSDQKSTTSSQGFCDKLPEINSSLWNNGLISFRDNYIVVDKDSREAISVVVQEHFVANRDSIVIGSQLAEACALITSKETQWRVVFYPRKLNMLRDTLNQSLIVDAGVNISDLVNFNGDNRKMEINAFTNNTEQTYEAWAVINADTGALAFGENMLLEPNAQTKQIIFNF